MNETPEDQPQEGTPESLVAEFQNRRTSAS